MRFKLPGALLLTLVFALSAGSLPARAEIASAWVEGLNSRARLVAGTVANGLLAGIEINLSEGWKTYWRNPGTGGIRPEFNWSGSENVRDIRVRFPAPKRFTDDYGTSIGYKRSVVFPVEFEAINPLEPQILRLSLDYAVCEALCIPAHASISLMVPGGVTLGPSVRLMQGVSLVPKPGLEQGARILKVEQRETPNLMFQVLHPGQPKSADAFAEGPVNWYLPAPVEVSRETAGDHTVITYSLDLSGRANPKEDAGAALRFTLIGDSRPVEQIWHIE